MAKYPRAKGGEGGGGGGGLQTEPKTQLSYQTNERGKLKVTVIDLAKFENRQNVIVGSKYIAEPKFCMTCKHLVHVLWKKVDLFISFSKNLDLQHILAGSNSSSLFFNHVKTSSKYRPTYISSQAYLYIYHVY